jgi:hypothetical protein
MTGRWLDHWEPEDEAFWQRTGRTIANRNLLYSVISEHIGFSVWTLWSVMVLFMGPEYGIDAAGKFFLSRPDARRRGAAVAVHVRRGEVRRPELDDRQRGAAARPDVLAAIVMHPGPRTRRSWSSRASPASAAATSPRR